MHLKQIRLIGWSIEDHAYRKQYTGICDQKVHDNISLIFFSATNDIYKKSCFSYNLFGAHKTRKNAFRFRCVRGEK